MNQSRHTKLPIKRQKEAVERLVKDNKYIENWAASTTCDWKTIRHRVLKINAKLLEIQAPTKSPSIEHWMENNQLVVEDKPFCKKTKKSMASFSSDVLISVFRKKGDISYDIKKLSKSGILVSI